MAAVRDFSHGPWGSALISDPSLCVGNPLAYVPRTCRDGGWHTLLELIEGVPCQLRVQRKRLPWWALPLPLCAP